VKGRWAHNAQCTLVPFGRSNTSLKIIAPNNQRRPRRLLLLSLAASRAHLSSVLRSGLRSVCSGAQGHRKRRPEEKESQQDGPVPLGDLHLPGDNCCSPASNCCSQLQPATVVGPTGGYFRSFGATLGRRATLRRGHANQTEGAQFAVDCGPLIGGRGSRQKSAVWVGAKRRARNHLLSHMRALLRCASCLGDCVLSVLCSFCAVWANCSRAQTGRTFCPVCAREPQGAALRSSTKQ